MFAQRFKGEHKVRPYILTLMRVGEGIVNGPPPLTPFPKIFSPYTREKTRTSTAKRPLG